MQLSSAIEDAALPSDLRRALLDALAEQERTVAALRDLPLAVLAASSPDEALTVCMEAAMALTGMECAGAYLRDRASGVMRLVRVHGVSEEFEQTVRTVSADSDWLSLLSDRPRVIRRTAAPPPIEEALRREGIEGIACVPAAYRGETVGSFTVASRRLAELSPGALDALASVAAAAAVALLRFEAESETARAHAEAAQVLERTTDGYFAFDHDFRFTAFNPASERFLNRKAEDVLGKPWLEAFPEAEGSILHEQYYRAARERIAIRFDTYFPTPPYEGWFEISVFPSDQGLSVFFRIVTERKLAEQALRESEERHRALFEEMAQGVVYQDTAGRIVSANPAAERILGLTLDQMQGRTSMDSRWQAVREDGSPLPGAEHPAMVALRTGREVRDQLLGILNPERNERRWLVVNAVPRFGPGETEPYEVFATFTDITERRRAQAELEQALQFNREVISSAGEGLVVYDREMTVRVWNPFMERLTGLPASEVVGRDALEVFPHLRDPGLEELRRRTLAGETLTTHDVWFSIPSTGRSGWTINAYAPHRSGDGAIIGMIATVRDIGERKQAERQQQLQRDLALALANAATREETLHASLEALMALGGADCGGIYVVDSTRHIATLAVQEGYSERFVAALGRIDAESRGARAPVERAVYGPPGVLGFSPEYEAVVRADGIETVAVVPVTHRGRLVAHFAFGYHAAVEIAPPLRSALEAIAATVGSVLVRLEVEAALRASEENMRSVIEAAPDAITTAADGRYVYVNPAAVRLFRAESAEELIGQDFVEERIHPDSRPIVRQRLSGIVGEHEVAGLIEETYLRMDGTPVRVEVAACPVVYEGKPAATAFVRDVTEQRRNAARLEALLQLHHMPTATEEEILSFGMEAALRLSDSSTGFLGCLDRNEEECRILVWAPHVESECGVAGGARGLRVDHGGLWAEAVRRRDYLIANDVAADPGIAGRLPEGHVPIRRFLGIPIIDDDRVVALAGIANKIDEYDETDAHNAAILLQDMWQHVRVRRDRQEREQLQSQLQRSQRLESLGVLAGGIAHDFNNILAGILGYGELALRASPEDSEIHWSMRQVIAGVARARDLVQQILAFSRQSESEQRPTQLGPLLREALRLVRASLPSTIEIEHEIDPQTPPVMADASQIHQVVVNLCANADYAMRDKGGTLTVTLAGIEVDEGHAGLVGVPRSGPYARITVADTGCGMDAATRDRIFEPFFTTKPTGQGTGLGLATCHGIVAGHRGAITVYSEPGRGSCFHVYLPAVPDAVVGREAESTETPTGSGRVLFVDDEPDLVAVAGPILGSLGYEVRGCTSPLEALEELRADPGGFVLLMTDQTMPRMTGTELVAAAREIRRDLPVLLMTGFSHRISPADAEILGLRSVLLKPYTVRQLAQAVASALAASRGDGRA